MSSLVLKIPVCTRAQAQSANPALLSTPLLSVELTATPTPPRYPHIQLLYLTYKRDI